MTNKQFEQWMDAEKAKLAECLRGSGRLDEEIPDMPGISDPDSLCEQFYDSIGQPINVWVAGFPKDGIDWQAVEKELKAFADEVWTQWMQRKKAQDKREAYEMGRE
ncbi:hypothetical protein [Tychonema sp. LEGE 07203]|uniref:hypothetical protein n=1 Tax=Tychonema sp. LEGE 07203 TaxID=1828671 RepID=UPI00187FEA3F|nr:hypothetical protein [Tychonema sp. LEGE 07203]MBE9093286.1 hypothetical protein [Tychonema sp. LEGE 07203]